MCATDNAQSGDEFWLYDLKVTTQKHPDRPMICNHQQGDYFLVQGENLIFPENNSFPFYALASILPLLAPKQRPTSEHDWMSTDAIIACPDPHCGGQFHIERVGKRTFRHSETSGLPDAHTKPYWNK